ncbi:MAG: hypothetical protein ACE5GS_12450 [Kiloniellaceae bacterium]
MKLLDTARRLVSTHARGRAAADQGRVSPLGVKQETLRLNPDGSLVSLEAGSWFVCFVPPIDKQWWHRFVPSNHKHVFALRPEREGEWTVFEPWWTRLLVATITTEQAVKFLRWGAHGDVLLVREAVPGRSSQLRGMMTCAALAAHMLGRTYFVWTPHQLYRRLIREPNICRVDASALLQRGLGDLTKTASRAIWACDDCMPGQRRRATGAAKPFCMKCGRDL